MLLTQPDDEGHLHPVAYESCKLTAAERNDPAHVPELLAVVHSLRAFRHLLLGGGAPRPAGFWSDFDLGTDNQAGTSTGGRGSRAPAARTRTRSSLPAADDLECLRDVEQVLLQRRRVHRTIVCVKERTPAQRARGPREPAADRRKAPCAGHAQGHPPKLGRARRRKKIVSFCQWITAAFNIERLGFI